MKGEALMMHKFIENNRAELIARCKAKVAQRPQRAATEEQLKNGVPLFLEQLRRTLEAEEDQEAIQSRRISGTSGNSQAEVSEMGVSAAAHGKQLLELGFTVDQVVHDYGDLCQAITDLAVERDAPFAIDEFRTLNRCLDNAIADAVTEFSAVREATLARQQTAQGNERLGFLVHELRNALGTATLAVTALELGNLPISSSTGSVLKRCLAVLTTLTDRSLAEVRLENPAPAEREPIAVWTLISEAARDVELRTDTKNCTLHVHPIDSLLQVCGNRHLLLNALENLLQNAFKFSLPNTEVTLTAHASENLVLIEVADRCGGLPPGGAEHMFRPFSQLSSNRTGLGLGLAIAKQNIEGDGGSLTVRDVPGTGCVFTISLPLH
jgi:signal transduction histidine kinase